MRLKMTFRMWILAIVLVATIFALNPFNYFEKGVMVRYVQPESSAAAAGLAKGDVIKEINGIQISSLENYSYVMSGIFSDVHKINWTLKTNKGDYSFEGLTLGIEADENLTVISASKELSSSIVNSTLMEINGKAVKSKEDFDSAKNTLEPKVKLKISAGRKTLTFYTNSIDFTVSKIPKTRLKAGLDLAGGAKALVQPERKLSSQEMNDLITVSKERLNVYGLADITVRSASDMSGNDYMIVEVGGATPKELEELIGKQGKFEAKIGNETVFIGGKKDITSVCRNDAACSGIRECQKSAEGYWCRFEFVIYLSPEAAKNQARITDKLSINVTASGERILSRPLELYLDDKLVDTLQIDAGLKGKEATEILIRGPGNGMTQQEAIENAQNNMAKLQTVLITGSLPFKLSIAKLDSISPLLGDEFIKNIFLAAIGAAIGVILVILIKYRTLSYALPMLFIAGSEILITLGVAAAINWNLDLSSIAGIIAAIGTGVNDQIVIVDESKKGGTVSYSIKERIKRAFFIIFGCFSTVFVAMLPLWWAGAGMVRGFAVTTIIGISIGVFITRPAFSDIISQIIRE